MCDIYCGECKICGADLPVHLGDYDTKREEVEVFCSEHLPKKDVRVFTLLEDDVYEDLPYVPAVVCHHIGWKMGIRYLTENARENKEKNYPNIGADWETEDR
jgi:hypothetical protein